MGTLRGAVLVAHPDDETLWAGGFLLDHPEWDWFIGTICRGSDRDRAPRFRSVTQHYRAAGIMADMDDGVDQNPLPPEDVEHTIAGILPVEPFDLVLTHGPRGEYTRHRRHEETSRAVRSLWVSGRLTTHSLWMFAYQDRNRTILPEPAETAHRVDLLSDRTWHEKYRIVTRLYGFAPDSWEARATPRREAFWCFDTLDDLAGWEAGGGGSG